MNEPRPAMISARPPDSRSSVANCWKTRTGSSELMTLTALVSRMRDVRAAAAASTTAGADHHEVGPVVLAHAEHVEARLVGEDDLLDEVAQPLVAGSSVPVAGSGASSPKLYRPISNGAGDSATLVGRAAASVTRRPPRRRAGSPGCVLGALWTAGICPSRPAW